MNKISIVSFSLTGGSLAKRIQGILMRADQEEYSIETYALAKYAAINGQTPVEPGLSAWCAREWEEAELLVFVGASGIAVRTIAPYVKSKVTDPAVIVIDEAGTFVISLLSGHLGGANEWTQRLSSALRAVPVITTATDVEHMFAVDVWAKKNGLAISSMKLAKEVSADVLHGRAVYFGSEIPWEGELPRELKAIPEGSFAWVSAESEAPVLIWCGVRLPKFFYPSDRILHLIPKCVTVGVGCRREKEADIVQNRVFEVLTEHGIAPAAVRALASIDLKKEEEGILHTAEVLQVPFVTYTKEELLEVKGEYTPSAFVAQITGVDNVCERAAVRHSGGELVIRKQAGDGVTVAACEGEWRIRF